VKEGGLFKVESSDDFDTIFLNCKVITGFEFGGAIYCEMEKISIMRVRGCEAKEKVIFSACSADSEFEGYGGGIYICLEEGFEIEEGISEFVFSSSTFVIFEHCDSQHGEDIFIDGLNLVRLWDVVSIYAFNYVWNEATSQSIEGIEKDGLSLYILPLKYLLLLLNMQLEYHMMHQRRKLM
jgi:hypothetical protein